MCLELRNAGKEYIRGGRVFSAVKNVNLSVTSGEFVGIIGRSGSGKSTLLNLTAGLLIPTAGEILINGKDISKLSDKEASLLRNSIIGYVPLGQSLLSNLSVLDNIRLPFYLTKREGNPDEKALKLLSRFRIKHLADSSPSSLSGGEMRRTAIARALINSPEILLADEPTSDLDAENSAEIAELFREISNNGTSVIMVTHEPDTIKNVDRVCKMEAGSLIESR